ncbi:MAG: pyridoxal-dependent decarboxylase [Bryobacteraceae bacterium]|jgi:glutamate/tyrosine decarboxylase-like PLP-dependent enzyme
MHPQQPLRDKTKQLGAWFLGPKAENAELQEKLISFILQDYFHWRRNYYPSDEILVPQNMRREAVQFSDDLQQKLAEMLAGLRRDFPFYSPRYFAHMLSDQTMPSVLGYFAGLLYNPNNVSPEAAPVTERWELEIGHDILSMLGYKTPGPGRTEFGWAHVTSGGTVANLETLWAARNVRYFPFAALQVAKRCDLDVPLLRASGNTENFKKFDERACFGLTTSEVLHLHETLLESLVAREGSPRAQALERMSSLLAETGCSLPQNGTALCFSRWPPAIFASGAAHYSIQKAANVLGIGAANVIHVDVDDHFRLDPHDLDLKLRRAVDNGVLPLAVIASAGTTEEGAVDPIHKVADLRQKCETHHNTSFWLHVDAAWGGYLRTLFAPGAGEGEPDSLAGHLDAVRTFVARPLDLSQQAYSRTVQLAWGDREVCSAFLAIPKADSVTVDPHKMGYVPYPCGVAAFRSDRVRPLLTEAAAYLASAVHEEACAYDQSPPRSIGPYILEGSKPGSAVAGCWLSHRMIPLNRDGYGEICRASLLAARELYERLVHWAPARQANGETLLLEFVPLTGHPPDTNIVCFLVRRTGESSPSRMNDFNRALYRQFTIDAEYSDGDYSYSQPYFLSHTVIRYPNYTADPLARLAVDPVEYRKHGLFVLRATLMSPYIVLAEETGAKPDYLAQFVERLAARALAI